MHILILSKRNGRAQERMLAAATAIGRVAGIDPALIEALTPRSKDLAIRAMEQREAIADLLEALAISAGIPLTESADEEAPAEEPAAESVTPVTEEPAQEAVSLPESTETLSVDSGEALPTPVLEEGIEPTPDEQITPLDEQPAEEPASEEKPRGKRSSGSKKK